MSASPSFHGDDLTFIQNMVSEIEEPHTTPPGGSSDISNIGDTGGESKVVVVSPSPVKTTETHDPKNENENENDDTTSETDSDTDTDDSISLVLGYDFEEEDDDDGLIVKSSLKRKNDPSPNSSKTMKDNKNCNKKQGDLTYAIPLTSHEVIPSANDIEETKEILEALAGKVNLKYNNLKNVSKGPHQELKRTLK